MRWLHQPHARTWRCAPADPAATTFHQHLPNYHPTPLINAGNAGNGTRLVCKDESERLGLPAFKILGASWAVHKLLNQRADTQVLVAATDGNHGRAVARAAAEHKRGCKVFVPNGVHPTAIEAIASEGAQVVRVAGSYDEAVHKAAEAAGAAGHALVQDTALPGYTDVPQWIVDGYATLFRELDAQLAVAPDLVVVPAGVGSLAQAAVTHYRSTGSATAVLTVEPVAAACVLASLRAGALTTVSTSDTIMAGLNCGTPSPAAWEHLRHGLDAAIAITDADSRAAAVELADAGIAAGPCGAAALAGARAALATELAGLLGIGATATVALISTEGPDANPH
ncbi:pyridoxal-phosphate dependent enzyme [Actinokineospora sp. NBRC 105648]|uniref:pyridoxal-phosphate dependent enzyme n=1 Tax=Actinokineospora sp. NBRC 105648 TaxID=3032206 RepID=UPI0024A0C0C9|nr:pyridoxal-phosphate dependent enzyme [Actinokineospora sp. NBRC 105648]GLZ36577.1 PLP-dependent lyase/thiolase [Actinokineospora sp. NBRC 105648]